MKKKIGPEVSAIIIYVAVFLQVAGITYFIDITAVMAGLAIIIGLIFFMLYYLLKIAETLEEKE